MGYRDTERIVVAGDWHGNTDWALHVIGEANERLTRDNPMASRIILHLGDFGVWPGTGGTESGLIGTDTQFPGPSRLIHAPRYPHILPGVPRLVVMGLPPAVFLADDAPYGQMALAAPAGPGAVHGGRAAAGRPAELDVRRDQVVAERAAARLMLVDGGTHGQSSTGMQRTVDGSKPGPRRPDGQTTTR